MSSCHVSSCHVSSRHGNIRLEGYSYVSLSHVQSDWKFVPSHVDQDDMGG